MDSFISSPPLEYHNLHYINYTDFTQMMRWSYLHLLLSPTTQTSSIATETTLNQLTTQQLSISRWRAYAFEGIYALHPPMI